MDAWGFKGPGAVLLEEGRIVASGAPADIGVPQDVVVVERPNAVVMPALANTHCHLDLSHLGPAPYAGDFTGWIEGVRGSRLTDPQAVADAVRRGIALARAGGTALVGDIAGGASPIPARELRASGLGGVSYLEVIGPGSAQPRALQTLEDIAEAAGADRGDAGVVLGVSPHAPYTCGPQVYRGAARLGLPLSTHVAETPEEIDFVRSGEGPLAGYLGRLGLRNGTGSWGLHPVDHVAGLVGPTAVVAAHLNYIEDRHLDVLAARGFTVAYCPRASAYFGHDAHRYRDMLAAGVNVTLGTDGLLCLDTPDRISVLDEMRVLYRRDGTDPATLLRMATVAGARALGVDEGLVTLEPGPTAGLIAVPVDAGGPDDPLLQALQRDDAPEWVAGPYALSVRPR